MTQLSNKLSQNELRELILNQPDFKAEETEQFSTAHAITDLRGLTVSYSVAKRGSTYWRNRGSVTSYHRRGEALFLFYARSREYVISPRLGLWYEDAASPSLLAAGGGKDLLFEQLGEEELDGHRCTRIQVSGPEPDRKKSTPATVVYFLAEDMQNLIIRTMVTDVLGETIYSLRNVAFNPPEDLFSPPTGYQQASSDPTAEYRLRDHFQIADTESIESAAFREAVLKRLPLGTPEEAVYHYLVERQIGNDRLSSYRRADDRRQIVCRIEFDPTLPGAVKRHFAVVFELNQEKQLIDVRLKSWVSAP